MNNYQRLPNTEQGDHGGVHVNSGIPNKAFYNYYTAVGMENAEVIWHRALAQSGLVARSQFIDFTNAVVSSCKPLVYIDRHKSCGLNFPIETSR